MPGIWCLLIHPGFVFPPVHVFLKTVLPKNTWPGLQHIWHSAALHWVLEKHTLRCTFCGGSLLGMLSAAGERGTGRGDELGWSSNQGPSHWELWSWDGFSEMSQVRQGGRGLDPTQTFLKGGYSWGHGHGSFLQLRVTPSEEPGYEPNGGNTLSNWKRSPWADGRTEWHTQASPHKLLWLPFFNQI